MMSLLHIFEKIGTYKVAYFFAGLVMSALMVIPTILSQVPITAKSLYAMTGASALSIIIAAMKEAFNGVDFCWKNVLACALGTVPVWIVTMLGVYFNILNQ